MSVFLYVEINMVGSAILILLLFNNSRSGFKEISIDQQIFNSVLFLNLLIFVFDAAMWLMEGKSSFGNPIGIYIAATLYYISNPLICFLWFLYVNLKIYESKVQLIRRIWFYGIPIFINTLMSLASPFTKWLFFIDDGNHYKRGPLFLVMASIAFFYLAASLFIAAFDFIKNGWKKYKSVNLYIIAISLWNFAAAALQTLFFGISIIWVCCMLACVCVYINLQNKEVSTDYLTGLYNRRRFDQHLYHRITSKRRGGILFLIMLDLDEFKSINDTLGHDVGDSALTKTAEILRKTCNKDLDFIARFGGDEFVIVGERVDSYEIAELINHLYSNAEEYNQSSNSKIKLKFSTGYSVLKKNDTAESLLAEADEKMYQCKNRRKESLVQNLQQEYNRD